MRPKSIILLTLALGCGLIASIGINQVMAHRREVPTQVVGETTPIFVAIAEIGVGDPLTPQVLKVEPWPKEKVPAGALGNLEDVEGRRSRSKFYPGEPILEAKLLPKGENGGSAIDMIPKGMRVVPIRVDAVSGASGMILPGDRVDLLVHLDENPTRGVTRAITRTFLQNVKIFAVDDLYDRPGTENKALAAKTISVLVTPEQAELVALASNMGSVRLVMRSASDTEAENTGGADLQKLLIGRSDMDSESDAQSFMTALKPKAPTPEPVQTELVESEPEAPVETQNEVFTMVILDGSVPREVEFRRGKPVNTAALAPPALPEDKAVPAEEPPTQSEESGETGNSDSQKK
ncbi:MAG TPA: Flp pilus assembly protein CpaB [Pirellulales bacterium]|nr:Flp pilus assembly protein CpaB [Pirellulales bacterium]